MAGIGVDRMGDAADAAADASLLRLENLDTDIRPLAAALEATRAAVDADAANSYLPFPGHERLRRAAAAHVGRLAGVDVDWRTRCLISAGGLNGILDVLLALVEPGDEVVLTDPIYVGLLNRVRLAGATPRLVPLAAGPDGWRLDREALAAAVCPATRMLLLMSPSMPSGHVLDAADWAFVAGLCEEHDLLLLYDAAMERILFDGRPVLSPLALPELAERTVVVGSASKELRMIGWRVGWIVAPPGLVPDIGLVAISNVVCQTGIAQDAVAVALEAGDADVAAATGELRASPRRAAAGTRRSAGRTAGRRLVAPAGRGGARPRRRDRLPHALHGGGDRRHSHDRLGRARSALRAPRVRERAGRPPAGKRRTHPRGARRASRHVE